MKNYIVLLMMVVLLLSIPVSPVFAQGFEVRAQSAILMDATTGRVVFEQDGYQRFAPASITKMMTLKLGLEAIESGRINPDDVVTVSERAWMIGGSSMFLNVGDRVSVEELLKGIAVVSGNDACIALAEYISGSEEVFVQEMNARAKEIGLINTNFANSHGLDASNHYMTAYDIALLAMHSIKTMPRILEYHSQLSYTYADITQHNRNPLLYTYPGADGLKTGMTDDSGYSLAGTAKQNNTRLIGVLLGTVNETVRHDEMVKMLNYGFRNFETMSLLQPEQVVELTVNIRRGATPTVEAMTAQELMSTIPLGEKDNIEIEYIPKADIAAPIARGDVIGKAVAMYEGEELGTVNLVAAKDVPRAGFFRNLWLSIVEFFSGLVRVAR